MLTKLVWFLIFWLWVYLMKVVPITLHDFDIFIFIPLLLFFFLLHLIKSESLCSTLNSWYNKHCIILSCWKKCLFVLVFKKYIINFNGCSFSLLVKWIDVYCLDLNFIVHLCISVLVSNTITLTLLDIWLNEHIQSRLLMKVDGLPCSFIYKQ